MQRAARPLVYVFVCATLLSLIAVVAVWVLKPPAVPPPGADERTIATYRELTGIAGDPAKDLLEEIFTKALLPLLLAFGGVLIGRNLKKRRRLTCRSFPIPVPALLINRSTTVK